jgi:magnesium chelatase subunit D
MNPVKQASATIARFELPAAQTAGAILAQATHSFFAPGKGELGCGSRRSQRPSHRLNWYQTLAANLGRWPLRLLKFQRRRSGDPVMHLVLLDTSASTLRNNRLAIAKAAILQIAEQAYLAREQLGILGFGNQRVQTLLPRKRAPKALRQLLDQVEAGGGTPLRQVVEQAIRYQRRLRLSQPELRLRNYLITDGKSSASLAGLGLDGDTMLIDIESSRVNRGRGSEFAAALNASYLPLQV